GGVRIFYQTIVCYGNIVCHVGDGLPALGLTGGPWSDAAAQPAGAPAPRPLLRGPRRASPDGAPPRVLRRAGTRRGRARVPRVLGGFARRDARRAAGAVLRSAHGARVPADRRGGPRGGREDLRTDDPLRQP